MSNGNVIIIHLIVGLIKKTLLFSRTTYWEKQNRSWIAFFLLCNKILLKNATGVDSSQFTKNNGLANVKPEVDKLDIGKSEATPVNLRKLSDVVRNEVVKKWT